MNQDKYISRWNSLQILPRIVVVTVLLFISAVAAAIVFSLVCEYSERRAEITKAIRDAEGFRAYLITMRTHGEGSWKERVTVNGVPREPRFLITDVTNLVLEQPKGRDADDTPELRYIATATIRFQVEQTDEQGRSLSPVVEERTSGFRVYQDNRGKWRARINITSLPTLMR